MEHTSGGVTRWTVSVSRDTDIAVRTFLAQRGQKKGDLSKFIEEAVKWRVFEQTLADTRERFSDVDAETLQALVDEAVGSIWHAPPGSPPVKRA